MGATSANYYVFIAVVFLLYWLSAGHRLARLSAVLLASLFFCAQFGIFYVLLIPACASVDYLAGLGLMRFRNTLARRAMLGASVCLNLGLLISSRHMGWIFPLGLSFYVFQALTYTIDLYRRDAECTRSLLAHLSAVSFFPTDSPEKIVG